MADIVNSLFGLSTNDIQQKRNEEFKAFQTSMVNNARGAKAKVGASLGAGIGAGLGKAAAGWLGIQDPELERAAGLEKILKDTQDQLGDGVQDPTVLYPTLQKNLNDAGFSREAMQLGEVSHKVMQESALNKAKLASEQAQLVKAQKETLEKRFQVAGKNIWDNVEQKFITSTNDKGEEDILSTDKLMSQQIAILNDPKTPPQAKIQAQAIYDMILPTKQPAQLSQPSPIQVTDNAGNVSLINPVTKEVTSMGGIGKPSGTYEKLKGAKQKALSDTTYAINQLTELVTNKAFDKATGSGLGALADSGAGFFGVATEGAQANAAIAPIADLILKQVPRFEGPQSDKDTASYKEAAGNLSDPKKPADVKVAAAKTIIKIMKDRQGQFIDKEDVGSEGDPIYSPKASVAPKASEVSGSDYKRYLKAFTSYKGNPQKQQALTKAARDAGVVK